MSKILVVVDPQVDFTESGKLPVPDTDQAIERIATVLIPEGGYDAVIATKDWHEEYRDTLHLRYWGDHCIAHTPGAEFAGPLAGYDFDLVLYKHRLAPDNIGLLAKGWIREGVTEVDVVGTALEWCVAETASEIIKAGVDSVRVLTPYTGSFGGKVARNALESLRELGVVVDQTVDA